MTATIEDVAGWPREAAELAYLVSLRDGGARDKAIPSQHCTKKMEIFNDRAAQVEAMGWPNTCDTCEHWDNSPWQISPETRLCLFPEKRNNNQSLGFVDECGPKFGCIHHEDKQLIKDSK